MVLLILFQVWPQGTLLVGSCDPLTYVCEVFFLFFLFFAFPLLAPIKYSRLILCISCSNLTSAVSLRSHFSLYWRMVLEAQIWVKVCLLLLGYPFPQALTADRAQKHMCDY